MAVTTIEILKETTARLRKKLSEGGDALDATKARALGKRIRRAQRRRRRMEAAAARAAKKAGAAKAE